MARPPKPPATPEPDPGTALQRIDGGDLGPALKLETGRFESAAQVACFSLSGSDRTRKAYWSDAKQWFAFCEERGPIDLWNPPPSMVTGWLLKMRNDGLAPKTQNRRMSALSSIYERVRRDHIRDPLRAGMINPFDEDYGPKRSSAPAREPTPIAQSDDVQAMLASCTDAAGVRDAALIRIMWGTGARCVSMVSMTHDRLAKEPGTADGPSYVATVIAKGGNDHRILITGTAAVALELWLADLQAAKFGHGPVWRKPNGDPMNEKAVWTALKLRAKKAGVTRRVSPHMFRVAFLTYNPASIQAKQSAAGHADPKTTAMYDRHDWRGREAFESMPDPEDVK